MLFPFLQARVCGHHDMGSFSGWMIQGKTRPFVAVFMAISRRVKQLFSQKNTPIKKIFVFLPVEYLVKI
jgi:hypothetical protein